MDSFRSVTNGFNFVYEKRLAPDEEVVVKMPVVSPNKRGFNDIGWQSDNEISVYGTLSIKPEKDTALWQELNPGEDVNKTISAIKIVNNGDTQASVVIRVIMN